MVGIVRILFYIFIFFVVLIPIALVIFLILKSKKSAWKGEIVGKKELDKEDFDTNEIEHIYKVIVRIDGGRDKHMEVDRDRYEMWNIGDRLEKKSGEMWPEKV
ncbi:MAG: hypothetical protein PHP08_04120 [Candidatus Dojkabacteria bacterium]|nr:hypothetical protein [Candidatus Dojkabacteria bacterium]